MGVSIIEQLLARGYSPVTFRSLRIGQEIRIPVKDSHIRAVIIEHEVDGGTAEGSDFPIMCIFDGEEIVYVKD